MKGLKCTADLPLSFYFVRFEQKLYFGTLMRPVANPFSYRMPPPGFYSILLLITGELKAMPCRL